MSVLGVSDFIARKQRYFDTKTVHVDALGGEIEIRKMPAKRYAEILDHVDTSSAASSIDSEQRLVYESCPIFRKKELQEAFGVTVPEDVVLAALDQNLSALHAITAEINAFYANTQEELKN